MAAATVDVRAIVPTLLREFWAGREAILLLSVFDGASSTLFTELAAVGARVSAVVCGTVAPGAAAHTAASVVTNEAPDAVRVWSFDAAGPAPGRAQFERLLADPGDDLVAWLRAFDPRGEHVVIGGSFTGIGTLAGRAVHGWRRPRWAAVEDKTTIDELWRQAAVPAPRHRVLPVNDPGVPEAVQELDGGLGVVLAMDSSTGFRGDSAGLRWARSGAELDRALEAIRGHSHSVRIAQFIAGTPCSILGMVLEDGVAVFDPIEIVTLYHPATARLTFCGSSTRWRPDPQAAREMRAYTRAAGTHLARTIGYRGIFSVDGVLGEAGFAATELNPRHASGLGLRAGWPEFPLYLFQRAVQEGLPELWGLPSAAVEEQVRATVRDHPSHAVRLPWGSGPPAGGDSRTLTSAGHGPIEYLARQGSTTLVAASTAQADESLAQAAADLAGFLGAEAAVPGARLTRAALRELMQLEAAGGGR